MKREYWLILIVYIVMQLSSLFGVPLTMRIIHSYGKDPAQAIPLWLIFSFSIAFILILFILRKEFRRSNDRGKGSSFGVSVLWAVFGVFLALFAQSVAANIEHFFGVPVGSENTKEILKIIELFPMAVLVSSVIGPILEEIVFRKIIFGALYKRFNFFIAALISSVIFALAHQEPQHILLYASMGFTFAYLYVKTKHILVPMFAHISMNTFVVLIQIVYKGDLGKAAHSIQNFIGGFL